MNAALGVRLVRGDGYVEGYRFTQRVGINCKRFFESFVIFASAIHTWML
jgi:hypothetical protein